MRVDLNGAAAAVDPIAALALANYGHFTTVRVEGRAVRGLALHLERLARDCRTLFDVALDLDRVRDGLRRAVPVARDAVIARVTIFDPGLSLDRPAKHAEPQVLVTTRPVATRVLRPLRVQSVRARRELAPVKHVGLFSTLHSRRLARQRGFDDALFVDDGGCVSEGSTWNVGFFDGERLIWPEAACLAGVTMGLLNRRHRGPITYARVALDQVSRMDAVFAANAGMGIRAIGAIDATRWAGEHPIVRQLRREYEAVPAEPL